MNTYSWISLVAAYSCFILTQTYAQDQTQNVRRILNQLNQARTELNSMRGTLQQFDNELSDRQKRTCSVGINSHHCAVADLDRLAMAQEYLRSGYSPGKRSMSDNSTPETDKEKTENALKLLAELAQKRKDLAKITTLLDDADDTIVQQSKRTCQFELGGACRTEWASSIADQFYYLMSPHSPGKRKRRSPIKLMKRRIDDILNKRDSKSKNQLPTEQ